MRVIFLDFDGVLNSDRYIRQRDFRTQGNLDETRLPLLARIVAETDAVIVLTTTWRVYWNPDPALCAPEWKESGDALTRHGLTVYDRTPDRGRNNRDTEVREWLDAHGGEVESFVILDDMHLGWGDLADRLVPTNPIAGPGLTEAHVQKAVAWLKTPL